MNASHGAGSVYHVLGSVLAKPLVDSLLAAEFEFLPCGGKDASETSLAQPSDHGGANHASVAGYEERGIAGDFGVRHRWENR